MDTHITLNATLSKHEHIGTLIHELAHGELGHTRSHDVASRSLQEQQAETITAILCDILGIERQSVFYLKSWKLDEDIKSSFVQMVQTVTRIHDAITAIAG